MPAVKPKAPDFCESDSEDDWEVIDRLERERDEDVIPSPPPHPPKRRNAAKSESESDASASSRKHSESLSRKRSASLPKKRKRNKRRPRSKSQNLRKRARRKDSASPEIAKSRARSRGSPLVFVAPPATGLPEVIPVLHSVMMGKVQYVNAKGAFLQLSDGGPTRYFAGLLRRRPDVDMPRSEDTLFVKIVRIEAGLVMVDNRTLDPRTGEDKDPENERAEVETWLDIPSVLVGSVIGKKGATIRKLCDDSGADLRFDEVHETGKRTGAADGDDTAKSRTKQKVSGGAGDDLRQFLDAAQADEDTVVTTKVEMDVGVKEQGTEDGADLRNFLAEMMGGDSGSEDDEEQGEEDEETKPLIKVEEKIVEFTAKSLDSWESQLFSKMKDAGVYDVHLDKLKLTDCKGARIDLAKGGLEKKMFPIRVKYVGPASDDTRRKETQKSVKEEEDGKKHSATKAAAAYLGKTEQELKEEDEDKEPERASEIVISGAHHLTRIHLEEILTAKNLPMFKEVEHFGRKRSEALCKFASAEDAAAALLGLMAGFNHLPEKDPAWGPGLWRARNGHLKYRLAKKSDGPQYRHRSGEDHETMVGQKPSKPEQNTVVTPMARLRINGDAVEVSRAERLVREMLQELLGTRKPRGTRGDYLPQLKSGEMREQFDVPECYISRLIGKNGETITRLEKESNAKLRILSQKCQLVVQGSEEAVKDATERVEALLRKLANVPIARQPAASLPEPRQSALVNDAPDTVSESGDAPSPKRPRLREPDVAPAPETRVDVDVDLDNREEADPARKFQSGFTSNLAGARKLMERQLEKQDQIEMQECELFLRRQRQLDRQAQAAEDIANKLTALASKLKGDGSESDEEDTQQKLYSDWTEDTSAYAYIGKPALTSSGPGRIMRAITSRRCGRMLTVRLLAGGTLQAPEAKVLPWVAVVERWLGDCLYPPLPKAVAEAVEGRTLYPYEIQQRKVQAATAKVGFVAAEAANLPPGRLRDRPELGIRLVPEDGSKMQFVGLRELGSWSRAAERVYLVELCTTPPTLGHVAPFRHDYRAVRDPYAKGDLVLVESGRPGISDVGIVRKIVLGEKGEKLLAAAGVSQCAKRITRRCNATDKAAREGPMKALETAALPLLQARLPQGAKALGVGASADGSLLRLFVQIGAGSDRRTAAIATSAAAAALGALLGCETELLTSDAAPTSERVQPDAKPGGAKNIDKTTPLEKPENQKQKKEKKEKKGKSKKAKNTATEKPKQKKKRSSHSSSSSG